MSGVGMEWEVVRESCLGETKSKLKFGWESGWGMARYEMYFR